MFFPPFLSCLILPPSPSKEQRKPPNSAEPTIQFIGTSAQQILRSPTSLASPAAGPRRMPACYWRKGNSSVEVACSNPLAPPQPSLYSVTDSRPRVHLIIVITSCFNINVKKFLNGLENQFGARYRSTPARPGPGVSSAEVEELGGQNLALFIVSVKGNIKLT